MTQSTLERAQDLRDSVRDFRSPVTSEAERASIRQYWQALGIPNHVAALLRAREIEASGG